MPCHIWALRYAISGHIWAPPFQLTALHAPAFSGHRVCNPSLISHVTVPTLGLKPGVERSTVTGALCRAARAARVRAWCTPRAAFQTYYPLLSPASDGPIYTQIIYVRLYKKSCKFS